VAAFLMLVPMRMAAEGLRTDDAINRVLAENIHGLELDPRCVEIAVFAVALEAWRYPDASGKPIGVREIPAPNIACCGLKVTAKAQDWEALVPAETKNAEYVRQELWRLHDIFAQAPLLGSLLDPSRILRNDLASSNFEELTSLLHKALFTERPIDQNNDDDFRRELALSAQGLLEAAAILNRRYQLVVTNVPYLGRGKQTEILRSYCDQNYKDAKNDLANVFLERCIELSDDKKGGVTQVVMPQNWLFLSSYKSQRERLLTEVRWEFLVNLGGGAEAFECGPGNAATICMLSLSRAPAAIHNQLPPDNWIIRGIDSSSAKTAREKADLLKTVSLLEVKQKSQFLNPDARIHLGVAMTGTLLSKYASSYLGLGTGDFTKFGRLFWEFSSGSPEGWSKLQCSPDKTGMYGGASYLVAWDSGQKRVRGMDDLHREQIHNQDQSGQQAWEKAGVAVSLSGDLKSMLYLGQTFDKLIAALIPKKVDYIPAIWAFCSSREFLDSVRKIDQKIIVANGTIVKVPFDLDRWQKIASDLYPGGLEKPHSKDPMQWLFHGHPQPATHPLQVAVARMVGYKWPAESDDKMDLSDETHQWIARSKALALHADTDGIVCIPPVGREAPASDRLLNLLADAYGEGWSNDVLAQLLTAADNAGKSLETWLRDKFFTQHSALFGNRPFVWHVWDGLRDGFAALVNYHKLDFKTLEALIYTYLGDWIGRQRRDADNGVDGAQEKLAAAEALKIRLELILVGEAPYDIFVRWKPIEEQPIGWNYDLNDGVRLNIRPFLSVPDVGKKGAGVLRDKPKGLHWDKDRGRDVPSAPWYGLGLQYGGKVGDRVNDHHLSLADKRKAREKAE
jgi:hypothetical protein